MPSAAHRSEPLMVERAMRPLHPSESGAALQTDGPYVHPDDPLDLALQRMGKASVDELPVVSRAGARQVGFLGIKDVLNAYHSLSHPEQGQRAGGPVQNWLPAVAASSHMTDNPPTRSP